MSRPTRSARQLQEILIGRIEALPGMAGQITDVHLGGVRWMDGGEGGATWTVPILRNRDLHTPAVARVIRQTQMEFDLEAD